MRPRTRSMLNLPHSSRTLLALLTALAIASFSSNYAQDSQEQAEQASAPETETKEVEPQLNPIPADLLSDRILQAELGVNEFTTPSIELIFTQLDNLGNITYGQLRREEALEISPQRSQISLNLGVLIADGFAAVQANQMGDIETLGRNILEHAEALGTGERVRRHSRNLIQHATDGSRDELKESLTATQEDVEAEMVELRDVDLAHLVSLGGWLRAFQYACYSLQEPFQAERVRNLSRLDILRYYQSELEFIIPRLQQPEKIQAVNNGLKTLEQLLDRPRTRQFTRRDLDQLRVLADALVETISEVPES